MKTLLAVLPLFLAIASNAMGQSSVVAIGDLPGGLPVSIAFGASSNGSVITGDSWASDGLRAFRWSSETGMIALPTIPGANGYRGGTVSPSGRYITGNHGLPNELAQLAFVWSEATGMISVPSLPGGRNITRLGQITDDGFAVGQSDFDFTSTGAPLLRAVKWTPQGGLEALPLPSPTDLQFQSAAGFVLNDGRIFGSSNSGKWLYEEDVGFEMLPVGSYMNKINLSGDFMIGTMLDFTTQIPHRARYWTPDTGEVPLAPYGDDYAAEALFMSDDGSVIIGRGSQGWHVWVDRGMPVLFDDYLLSMGVDLSEWVITLITDISSDGSTITASGRHISWELDRREGIVITIPPPSSILPMLAIVLTSNRRRREQ